jgi:hypothetical protein
MSMRAVATRIIFPPPRRVPRPGAHVSERLAGRDFLVVGADHDYIWLWLLYGCVFVSLPGD